MSQIGGCKTEETVRVECGTNTNELQPISPVKTAYLVVCCCCTKHDGECCRRLSLELEDDRPARVVGKYNMLLVMKEWGVDVGINPSRPFNDNDCK